jgi:hypothetical protein
VSTVKWVFWLCKIEIKLVLKQKKIESLIQKVSTIDDSIERAGCRIIYSGTLKKPASQEYYIFQNHPSKKRRKAMHSGS